MLVNMSGGKKVENIINEIVEPVLLWTNSSPTSIFNPQTVNVSGDEYEAYLVEVCGDVQNSTKRYGVSLIKKASGGQVVSSMNDYGSGTYDITSFANRYVTVSGNSITFSNGYNAQVKTSFSQSSHARYAVPTRIWGVKFTL